MQRKIVNVLMFVVICFAIILVPANKGVAETASQNCPKKVVFQQNDKEVCAYNVTYLAANTTRQNDVFDIPTMIVIELAGLIGGPVGALARDAYYREGSRYFVRLGPEKEHEGYLRCANRWEVWSETGTRNWDNRNRVESKGAYYEWELKRKSGGARSWYKADFVWVSHHPDFKPDVELCEEIADIVLKKMRASRPKPSRSPRPEINDDIGPDCQKNPNAC